MSRLTKALAVAAVGAAIVAYAHLSGNAPCCEYNEPVGMAVGKIEGPYVGECVAGCEARYDEFRPGATLEPRVADELAQISVDECVKDCDVPQ
ncbi:hypothetical protein ACFL0V_05285 [Nanoarchaeota archaeon]